MMLIKVYFIHNLENIDPILFQTILNLYPFKKIFSRINLIDINDL